MLDLSDATRIKDAHYNLDSLKDENLNNRWGSYKLLEIEIASFERRVRKFGEDVVSFVVHTLLGDDLLCARPAAWILCAVLSIIDPPWCRYYIILNRIWPLLNSDEHLSKDLFAVSFYSASVWLNLFVFPHVFLVRSWKTACCKRQRKRWERYRSLCISQAWAFGSHRVSVASECWKSNTGILAQNTFFDNLFVNDVNISQINRPALSIHFLCRRCSCHKSKISWNVNSMPKVCPLIHLVDFRWNKWNWWNGSKKYTTSQKFWTSSASKASIFWRRTLGSCYTCISHFCHFTIYRVTPFCSYCLFLSIIPFDLPSAFLVHSIQKFIHTSILNSAALLDIAAKSVSHKVTAAPFAIFLPHFYMYLYSAHSQSDCRSRLRALFSAKPLPLLTMPVVP